MNDLYDDITRKENQDRRSGADRRQLKYDMYSPERRSGEERRSGIDRRKK